MSHPGMDWVAWRLRGSDSMGSWVGGDDDLHGNEMARKDSSGLEKACQYLGVSFTRDCVSLA